MALVRLNKYLADQGIASRREADRLIADGLISVNGNPVKTMGIKVDPEKDKISVDKKVVERRKNLIYIALNKPAGYVTSVKPTRLEPKVVTDLVDLDERVFPVGRLDKDTTGLLILTNDGTLTYQLTHPSSECEKEYDVKVGNVIRKGQMDKLKAGVKLWGERTKETQVKKISPTRLRIVLTEGKNRQIRRICQKVGFPVVRLKRIRIKNLSLGDLPEGEWRFLTDDEVKMLK